MDRDYDILGERRPGTLVLRQESLPECAGSAEKGNVDCKLAMWKKPTRLRFLFVVFLVALYTILLVRGSTESTRRLLQLRDEVSAPDRVVISVLVTDVNFGSQELTARLGFRLAGDIARDEVTPATDLQLLVNNVGGQQQYDFPAGKRMNRIEARFP